MGFLSDARIMALNSYENRVYQVGIDEPITTNSADRTIPETQPSPIIAKFYRPNRWTDEQILEEHQFTLQLQAMDIPAVPPLQLNNNPDESGVHCSSTLFRFGGYRFALFPRHGGRAPELSQPDHLYRLGKYIGRIHAVGKISTFKYRPTVTIQAYVTSPSRYLLENHFIPAEYSHS